MVLITLAALVSLLAWWLSARTSQRTRALIAYLEQNRTSFWQAQPRLSRYLTPVGVIAAYRRANLPDDPDFDALYQARKSGMRAQISAIAVAVALIGLVPAGTHFWGWTW